MTVRVQPPTPTLPSIEAAAASSSPDQGHALVPPDPQVSPKPSRRRFTASYKLSVLQEAVRCTTPGQVGALLRREGLYSSHLPLWRKQRRQGMLAALAPAKRGPKVQPPNPLAEEVEQLRRENQRLIHPLKQAETFIEFQ